MLIAAPLAETVGPDNGLQKHCMAATRPSQAVLELPTVLRRVPTSFAWGTRFIRRLCSLAAHRLRTHALLGAIHDPHDDPVQLHGLRFLPRASLPSSTARRMQYQHHLRFRRASCIRPRRRPRSAEVVVLCLSTPLSQPRFATSHLIRASSCSSSRCHRPSTPKPAP